MCEAKWGENILWDCLAILQWLQFCVEVFSSCLSVQGMPGEGGGCMDKKG